MKWRDENKRTKCDGEETESRFQTDSQDCRSAGGILEVLDPLKPQ